MCLLAYTEAMNLTNYVAVVIPVTKADKQIDVIDTSYEPLNAKDRLNWKSCELLSPLSCLVTNEPMQMRIERD